MQALPVSQLGSLDHIGAEQSETDEQEIQCEPDQQDKREGDHLILPWPNDRQENEGRDGEGDDGKQDFKAEDHDADSFSSEPGAVVGAVAGASTCILAIDSSVTPLIFGFAAAAATIAGQ
jgi:hypothetical protein